MSAAGPDATGTTLQNFRLIERVSASVWRSEDIRNSKAVAVKILSKGLPKDPTKREPLIREVRQSAALFHSFLVAILEVVAVGDSLLLVMEWLQAQTITDRARGKPLGRDEFFRISYQILDVLKLLHGKGIVHGNVAGDSILVLPTGQAKLAGLNLGNILSRQGQPSQYQQKGNNLRAVSYMAPEQITGQPLVPATDIFSLGVVMYEMATGRLPYQAATAADVAHKIVDEQPPSPKAANPNIDNAVLSLVGGSLFKDPFKRFKDARAAQDAVNRVDAGASKFAFDVAKAAAAPAGAVREAPGKSAVLYVADIEDYEELMRSDPTAATAAAARMQQILGEAVYLFDGKVLDSFGARMVAELPSVESAIEAARKGEFDFSPGQQGGTVIPVRMLLHVGELQGREGAPSGAGVEKAVGVLHTLPSLTLYVSEDFVRRSKGHIRYRDAGARGGLKLSTIVASADPEERDDGLDPTADATAVEAAALVMEERVAGAAQRRKNLIIGLAVMTTIALGALIAVLVRSRKPDVQPQAASVATTTAASAPRTYNVLLGVTATDPTLAERAAAIRLAAVEILRSTPRIRLAESAGPDVRSFDAQVRPAANGAEIVLGTAAPAPAPDVGTGVQAVVQHVAEQLHLSLPVAASPAAYSAFADALTAQGVNDAAKIDAALRAAAKADPNFLPAQILAMRFYSAQNKSAEAVDAAKHVLAAEPDNVDAARMVARAGLATGDLASAFGAYAVLIRKNPNDTEALNAVGKYAVAINDAAKLNVVLKRLAATPAKAEVHEPDLLLASGRIDAAVQKYYEVEERVPNNPFLSLKIGRIAVLRHSAPIAEMELKRLEETDPLYGLHILKSYLAAQAGNKVAAGDELKMAQAASTPGDDYWTSKAEVAALTGNVDALLTALESAAQRKEPTATYILNDPLFSFLSSDYRFQKVREALLAQQNEIRAALAAVSL